MIPLQFLDPEVYQRKGLEVPVPEYRNETSSTKLVGVSCIWDSRIEEPYIYRIQELKKERVDMDISKDCAQGLHGFTSIDACFSFLNDPVIAARTPYFNFESWNEAQNKLMNRTSKPVKRPLDSSGTTFSKIPPPAPKNSFEKEPIEISPKDIQLFLNSSYASASGGISDHVQGGLYEQEPLLSPLRTSTIQSSKSKQTPSWVDTLLTWFRKK